MKTIPLQRVEEMDQNKKEREYKEKAMKYKGTLVGSRSQTQRSQGSIPRWLRNVACWLVRCLLADGSLGSPERGGNAEVAIR